MAQQPIRFDDGEAYERWMGVWSQSAGQVFLDWLVPPSGLRWIDVSCGNGEDAFAQQTRHGMGDLRGIADVREHCGQPIDQPNTLVGPCQQENAA